MTRGGTSDRIVFCDFDGTITDEESFIGMLKVFAPEQLYSIGREMKEMRITLREGVRMVVETIPARLYPGMLEYARTRRRRKGFEEFIDFLDSRGVPLVIISGGLKGLVEANLGPLVERTGGVYAADVETDHEFLRVLSAYEHGDELVAKARVMDLFPAGSRVAVGDGYTDMVMARHAGLVFARDHLASFLSMEKIPYVEWIDFHDIRARLEKEWGKT